MHPITRRQTIADALRRSALRLPARVAVLARNSHGFAALRFALARLGAVLVPINFMLKADEWPTSCATLVPRPWPPTAAWPIWPAPQLRWTLPSNFIWLPSEDPSEPAAGMLSFDLAWRRAPRPAGR
jgi:fatty-acyl-CoA synthase